MLEKILEEIEHQKHLIEIFGRGAYFVPLEVAKAIIRKHMGEGWIPIEEKLPEVKVSENVKSGEYSDNGKRFLITDKNGNVYESTFWAVAQKFGDDAIAWREKPEPYRPDKQWKQNEYRLQGYESQKLEV